MVTIKKGEIEFRRDSLILCVTFLVVSLVCTKVILNKLDMISTEAASQRALVNALAVSKESQELKEGNLMERLSKLEANTYALATLQKDNAKRIAELQRLLKKKQEE